ncbi:hypothetical protein MNBD_PLANCTO02-1037 [hydrothermal vent metagenome]|uniref:Uncharacterized protein n=1 Tax=hydrothermal vent metagenome TaxID=652676 RepID=A0A3B1DLS2_9ZZZZ
MAKKSKSRKKVRKDKKHRKERTPLNFATQTLQEWEMEMQRKRISFLPILCAKIMGYATVKICDCIEVTRTGGFGELAKDFELEKWGSFYLNEKKFNRAIRNNYRKADPILRCMIFEYRWLKRQSAHLSQEELNASDFDGESFAELITVFQQAWAEFNKELNVVLQGKDEGDQKIKDDAISQFFLTVWIPCMFVLGTSPATLFAKAASGDAYSIYNLIRLDKQAQYIPQISERLSFWLRNPEKYKSQLGCLDEARNGYIEEWKNNLHLKYAVIERVIKYSRDTKNIGVFNLKEFSKNDLRHLFDIIARDEKQGIIDEDFPVSDEAFKKGITRGSVSKIADTGWDNFLS